MSEPVYQLHKFYGWQDIDKQTFDSCATAPKSPVRKLYPASAYEALKEKLERLNGLYHSEVSKHQLDYNALKAENETLKEVNDSLHRSSQFTYECQKKSIADLKAENAAQAKLIEAIETLCTHDYESKDDFILRVKEKLKNGDSK